MEEIVEQVAVEEQELLELLELIGQMVTEMVEQELQLILYQAQAMFIILVVAVVVLLDKKPIKLFQVEQVEKAVEEVVEEQDHNLQMLMQDLQKLVVEAEVLLAQQEEQEDQVLRLLKYLHLNIQVLILDHLLLLQMDHTQFLNSQERELILLKNSWHILQN
jgi:hypothetical protein